MKDPLIEVATTDGRFSVEAFRFLFESLDDAVKLAGKVGAEGPERHVSGQDVLRGLRVHSQRVFGPLAAEVWRSWGVHSSLDWGRIVFLLVDTGLLARRDEDTIDDFRKGFDFDRAFVDEYIVPLPAELE